MEYDHLIIPGINYRRPWKDSMKDVRADVAEWHQREFKTHVKTGGDRHKTARNLIRIRKSGSLSSFSDA